MIDAQELHGRCEKFIAELDGSKTAFCARFKLSSNDRYAYVACNTLQDAIQQ